MRAPLNHAFGTHTSSTRPAILVKMLASMLLADRVGTASGAYPNTKRVIDGFSVIIRGHIAWNDWDTWSSKIRLFFKENFTYDFVHPFPKTHSIRDWYEGEHLQYNEAFPNFKSTNFLFLGEEVNASLQSYHTFRWNGSFGGVPPPDHSPLIYSKDLDFYIFEGDMIAYNWCMIDVVSILQQGGYQVLPKSPLPGGVHYLPPRAMDGIPSPNSQFVDPSDAEVARQYFTQMLQEDFKYGSQELRFWAEDMYWCGPGGIGEARSRDEYLRGFLQPLHQAFSNPSLEVNITVCEGNYCSAHFYFVGDHTGTWLGQAATGHRVAIRVGFFARFQLKPSVDGCVDCGLITDAWAQMDLPAAFLMMGVDLMERARQQHAEGRVHLPPADDAQAAGAIWEHRPVSNEVQTPLARTFRRGGVAAVATEISRDLPFVSMVAATSCTLFGVLVGSALQRAASAVSWRFGSRLPGEDGVRQQLLAA